ncbi:MAG: UvrD-helicase domain-containing protein [Planctomycetota bacterium]
MPADAPTTPTDETNPGSRLLEGLTEQQRLATRTLEGPVLVLAAAGSGKTRVTTRRIAYLIERGEPAWSILAVTFTNKAAREMRERIERTLIEAGLASGTPRGLICTTFHSLCARLLRRYADAAGLPADYSIYDTADQLTLVKRVIAGLELSTTNFPPRSVLSSISNAKNELIDAEAFERQAGDFSTRHLARIYKGYEAGKRQAGAVDFDDLLLLTARLLGEDATVRRECQDRWRWLLIDEYQDTNRAQFVIASLLAGTREERGRDPNIFVVGDPDQAIYSWRGADITNILEFEERFANATVIPLGENFRSTAPILGVADTLIRQNRQRKHKDLFTSTQGGSRVEVTLCRDEGHEASLVVDWFKRFGEEGLDGEGRPLAWRDMAVFYRTNALSRAVEDELRRSGVPYVVVRGTAFYQREEVKTALAYLRLAANQSDDVSLTRVVNTPTRGIGKASLAAAQQFASERGLPLFEALRRAEEIPSVSARAANGMRAFVAMVDSWTGAGTFMGTDVAASLRDLAERVIEESGLEAHYRKLAAKQAEGEEADASRVENLEELVSSAAAFEEDYDPADDPMRFDEAMTGDAGTAGVPDLLGVLRAYLESVSLVADADLESSEDGAVTLMTLHAAKGLEFAAAAIIGLEEGQLPHSRAHTSEADLEEERRLCFVGITRAMRRLHMTASRYRTVRGVSERTIPSRFLEEIGTEHVTLSDQSDPFAGIEGTGMGAASSPRRLGTGGPRELSSADEVERAAAGDKLAAGLAAGTTVRHPRFGIGVIETVSGGANARAQVNFRGIGLKTLVLEYARLEPVD